jgi:hypothetical protein
MVEGLLPSERISIRQIDVETGDSTDDLASHEPFGDSTHGLEDGLRVWPALEILIQAV